ncbi:MAG TPA: quercetin 2,3-dioxygenase [Dehalococcoidia bacterium]|nr:quercetin 2,3-dioxygenase [Dehalococcoidia bacterium]
MAAADGAGYVLSKDEGTATWFLDTLMVVKASGEQTGGSFTLIEQVMPAGYGPPLHIHALDDEAFYVLDGEITFICGDRSLRASAGSFVFLPRGVKHAFSVEASAPARVVQITSPSGFERFVAEAGEPARALTLPPPAPPDLGGLIAAAAKYGIEILESPGP